MSSIFTLSARRLAANHENAQHSTGPKSADGKARSSKNASTHNIFSDLLLQPGEHEPDFIHFRNALFQDLFPINFLECAGADRIVALHWKLRRLRGAEKHLNQMQNLAYQQQLLKEQEYIENKRERHLENCDKHNLSCTEEDLEKLGLNDLIDPDDQPLQPSPGFFIANALFTSHEQKQRITPFERLQNLEQKLQSMLHRAMKEYRQLQQDRRKQEDEESQQEDDGREPYCPFLNQKEDEDQDDNDQDNDDEENDDAVASSEISNQESEISDDPDSHPRHKAQHGATIQHTNRKNEPL